MAVLSAFQWDFVWLFEKLNVGRTIMVLVLQAKTEEDVRQ